MLQNKDVGTNFQAVMYLNGPQHNSIVTLHNTIMSYISCNSSLTLTLATEFVFYEFLKLQRWYKMILRIRI